MAAECPCFACHSLLLSTTCYLQMSVDVCFRQSNCSQRPCCTALSQDVNRVVMQFDAPRLFLSCYATRSLEVHTQPRCCLKMSISSTMVFRPLCQGGLCACFHSCRGVEKCTCRSFLTFDLDAVQALLFFFTQF